MGCFLANTDIKIVFLPPLFGILIDLFHSKYQKRKKSGFIVATMSIHNTFEAVRLGNAGDIPPTTELCLISINHYFKT